MYNEPNHFLVLDSLLPPIPLTQLVIIHADEYAMTMEQHSGLETLASM